MPTVLCGKCGAENWDGRVACRKCLAPLAATGSAPDQAAPTSGQEPSGRAADIRTEILRWRDKGLVSASLAQRLLAEYEPKPEREPAGPPEDEWPRVRIPLSAGMVLLYIGGLLVLVACIMLAGDVWGSLTPGGRFVLVLLPALALYASGAWLHLADPERRVPAAVMLLFACALLPFVLFLGLFAASGKEPTSEEAVLFVAVATLLIQAGTLYLFRSPLLTIPYPFSFLWSAIMLPSALRTPGYPLAHLTEVTVTLSGLALLALGVFFAYERKRAYAVMPDLVGGAAFLGGLAALGSQGHRPGWELLAVLACIGLITASASTKNGTYLLVASLFLVFNIFSIGYEYFSKTAGLPLTLILCGGLSIAVGYAMIRIRKERIAQDY